LADGARVGVSIGHFGVGQTAEVLHLRLHELVVVLVLSRLCELVLLFGLRPLLLAVAIQDLANLHLDLLDGLLHSLGLVEVLPLDCPGDAGALLSQLGCEVGDLHHDHAVLLRLIEVFVLDGLFFIGSESGHELADVLLVLLVGALLPALRRRLHQQRIGLVGAEERESLQSDLGEEVLLGGVRLVEEEAQVEAVEVDHDGLLLPRTAVLVAGELQVAVLVEALLLAAGGHVVEDVDLRADLAVVRHQLQLADVDHAVELERDLLRVGAKTTSLPAVGAGEEEGTHWVLLLFRTAGNYLEFQLPAH
jgi:hypothetical protein